MGPERPKLVGLICWILILGGFGGLALALRSTGTDFAKYLQVFPYPPVVTEVLLFLPRALLVIAGICMYERQGWARYLFILVAPLYLVHQHFAMARLHRPSEALKLQIYQDLLILGVVLYFLSILILFLRPARRYYKPPMYIDE